MTTNSPFSNQEPLGPSRQNAYRANFSRAEQDQQAELFFSWLHPDLRDLPGIDWAKMPASVAGYLVQVVGDSPYAPHIALAVGTALGSYAPPTLRHYAAGLNALFSTIRTSCRSWNGRDLTREVWQEYVTREIDASRRRSCLHAYAAVTGRPLAHYLKRLDTEQRRRVAPYLLPPLPAPFLRQYSSDAAASAAEDRRRKEQIAALLSYRPLLLALIQQRKQAAQRLLHEFREACRLADLGEALPLDFDYEAVLPEISRGARPAEAARVEQRRALLRFRLWNRKTWSEHSPAGTPGAPHTDTEVKSRGHGRPEREQYFVQYLGQASDLLWFGDLVEEGVLMHLEGLRRRSRYEDLGERDQRRLACAGTLGMHQGFATGRPGLLTPGGDLEAWLGRTFQRSAAALFDPESLYRGCLFGAALAVLILTDGNRVSELLQVSADRFTHSLSDEQENEQPGGNQPVVWLRHLLPKGKRTEEERQSNLISPPAYELLREIDALLIETHGHVPVVSPHQLHPNQRKLRAQPYLFQWQATFDGKSGALSSNDVRVLVQFILHGLELPTFRGEAFKVTAHLFLHMAARAAREAAGIPAAEVALLLHHRCFPSSGEYYSRMAAHFWTDREGLAANNFLLQAQEKAAEQRDERMHDGFEGGQWLLETMFGYCGLPGLCLCTSHHSLNIRCPYHFPDPAKRPVAVAWREAYARQAGKLETADAMVDAHLVRQKVQEYDDLIRTMDLLQQAIDDGTCIPPFLLPPDPEENKGHLEA